MDSNNKQSDQLDLLWGVKAIAGYIGLNERQTHYQIEFGTPPGKAAKTVDRREQERAPRSLRRGQYRHRRNHRRPADRRFDGRTAHRNNHPITNGAELAGEASQRRACVLLCG